MGRIFQSLSIFLSLLSFTVSADPFPPNWSNGVDASIHYSPAPWPVEPVNAADCGSNCGGVVDFLRNHKINAFGVDLPPVIKKSHEYYEKFLPDRLCPPEQAILTARQIVSCIENGEVQKASRYMKAHLDLVGIELQRVVDTQR